MRTMKDSGIPWIGKIPENWSTTKIKHHFDIIAGATPKSEQPKYWDGQISWITPADYKTQDKYVSHGRKYLTKEGYDSCGTTIVPANSIIFSKRAPVGTVAITANELCTNQGCLSCVIRNNQDTDAVYYYYAMSSFTEQFELVSAGATFKEIAADVFANFFLPRPPYSIQRNIAVFLDFECARIDAVMEQTRASIEEYKKLKQSIITEAVTKGIRPNRPMKDSGIEWIGLIPEEWEITKFKKLGKCRNGLTYAPEDQCGEEGTLVLRSSNIQDGKLELTDCVYVSKRIPDDLMVKPNDILICSRNGSAKLIGKNAIIPENLTASFGAFMMIYRCNAPRYLQYVLSSNVFSYNLGTFLTVSVNQLTGKNFDNIQFPYTDDAEEQAEIIAYLDNKCSEIDKLIKEKLRFLTEMENYKKALIYEYVTGKKEV